MAGPRVMISTEQILIDKFEQQRGKTGTRRELTKLIEDIGHVVEAHASERSVIKLSGVWNPDGSDCVIGEIVGDDEAVIK